MSPCACPICAFNRAHEEAYYAVDALTERSAETEMAYAFLLDEVRAAIRTPAPLRRRRLVKALRVVSARASTPLSWSNDPIPAGAS